MGTDVKFEKSDRAATILDQRATALAENCACISREEKIRLKEAYQADLKKAGIYKGWEEKNRAVLSSKKGQ